MLRVKMLAATVSLAAVVLAGPGAPLAQDKIGCRDHPAVSRFKGATILDCRTVEFDEAAFPGATLTGNVAKDAAAAVKASGKITALTYRVPEGKTAAEVAANYKAALTAAGYGIVSEHSGRSGSVAKVLAGPAAKGAVQPDRYLLARRQTPQGAVFVSVGTGLDQAARTRVGVDLRVVEERAVKTGQVEVLDAAALRGGIAAAGKVAVYGIHFDTGKAEVKPDSKAQLAEIAKMLAAAPALNVYVVGHTDNQGALAFNQDLSKRRAEAVVAALVRDHKVAPSRLSPAGVGPLAPVASNATEAGRAQNRRTEIVAR
jgi:outer membrane protein OmpA-like peptidoglycan-associated protein